MNDNIHRYTMWRDKFVLIGKIATTGTWESCCKFVQEILILLPSKVFYELPVRNQKTVLEGLSHHRMKVRSLYQPELEKVAIDRSYLHKQRLRLHTDIHHNKPHSQLYVTDTADLTPWRAGLYHQNRSNHLPPPPESLPRSFCTRTWMLETRSFLQFRKHQPIPSCKIRRLMSHNHQKPYDWRFTSYGCI